MPPKLVKLSEVVPYLEKKHNIEVTRQTVYNWAKMGKRNTVLKTAKRVGTLYTTERWVDEFIANVP